MTSPSQLKILVTGCCNGEYGKLFKRINDVQNKSGPFDMLLCVGKFFDPLASNQYQNLIHRSIMVPNIPIYILGSFPKDFQRFHPEVRDFSEGFELTDGITFLGRSGTLTASFGLKIAYLCGSYRSDGVENDSSFDHYSDKDLDSLVMSCQNSSSSTIIDILLTNEAPKKILEHLDNCDDSIQKELDRFSSVKISQLCKSLHPRYHFFGGTDLFYERPPYRNHRVLSEQCRNVTRFISMANVGNTKKMKWLYAFNIVPGQKLLSKELSHQPDGATEFPFRALLEQQQQQDQLEESHSNQYRFDLSTNNRHQQQQSRNNQRNFPQNNRNGDGNSIDQNHRKRKHQEDGRNKIDIKNCWFCLASPSVDKSLIISIGDHSYLALAKGGLTEEHLIILPIEHIRSTVEIESQELRDEIERFKKSLVKFYEQLEMIPVFFERNFRSAHFHIQVIGLPKEKVLSFRTAVDEIFKRYEYNEISLNENIEDVIPKGIPYFYMELYDHYKFFVRINTKKEFFPIQIGRELMAHKLLLNCPERINWKSCSSSSSTSSASNESSMNEEESTRTIRASFKPYDFTIFD